MTSIYCQTSLNPFFNFKCVHWECHYQWPIDVRFGFRLNNGQGYPPQTPPPTLHQHSSAEVWRLLYAGFLAVGIRRLQPQARLRLPNRVGQLHKETKESWLLLVWRWVKGSVSEGDLSSEIWFFVWAHKVFHSWCVCCGLGGLMKQSRRQ